jgi:hypothetical protein
VTPAGRRAPTAIALVTATFVVAGILVSRQRPAPEPKSDVQAHLEERRAMLHAQLTEVTPEIAAAALRARHDACPSDAKATDDDIAAGNAQYVNPLGVRDMVAKRGPSWLNCIIAADSCDDINDNIDCNPWADPSKGRRMKALSPDQLARRVHRGACLFATDKSGVKVDQPGCMREFDRQGQSLTQRLLAVKNASDVPKEVRIP